MCEAIITENALDVEELKKKLPQHSCCGALVQFEGIVRNHHEGRKVVSIEYESFQEMAKKELEDIVRKAKETFPVHEVFVAHRVGKVSVNETSVVVFVLSPHRQEAFKASQYVVDELKKRVPIWKKEFYDSDNATWI